VRRAIFAATLLLGLALVPAADALRLRDGHGLHVASMKWIDSRLLALSVTTSALPGPANVRVLLPSGYANHPRRRYPVLYLFHGTSGGASDWTTMGAAEQTTAGKPLIVVMPDIALGRDGGGWCTDWPDGAYKWETFHISQLLPWVDANLRTIRSRAGRAIAGLSQGGFCSTSYAARHPDLFGTALSYSGAPDIALDGEAQALVTPVVNATEVALDHVPINSMFGSRLSNEINWAAHDPATLAENLRNTNLFLYTGNGQNGPLDASPNPGGQVIEGGVEILTKLFHQRLEKLGIPSLFDDYGPGTHAWPYWARDLRESIDPIMADFASAVARPARVTYMSADAQYGVYGWTVSVNRSVREFSTLRDAWSGGFQLQGSGSATVVTPAVFKRGRSYRVTVGSRVMSLRADGSRRLRISVPLGPSNKVQEYPLDGPPVATKVYTTTVTIG
jgi:S-formylglutathione hydrolase FrmB